MKSVIVLLTCWFVIVAPVLSAQEFSPGFIHPYHLSIGLNKTTSLIFPCGIKSVDRGSKDVLIQKAKGVENILQVKAAVKDFEPTNLSIITCDGKFYSIMLDYAQKPEPLTISFTPAPKADISGQLLDEQSYHWIADSLSSLKGFLNKSTVNQRIRFQLKGMYLKNKVMWFLLELHNMSLIDYTPSSLRLFLRDRQKAKRTALQETELIPLFNDTLSQVKGLTSQPFILALRPFTIPSSKRLIIHVREQHGGRLLELSLSNRQLLKVKKL